MRRNETKLEGWVGGTNRWCGCALATVIKVLCLQVRPDRNLKERVVATASTFFHRVFFKTSLCRTDPLLVIPACICLAFKAEEYGQVVPGNVLPVMQSEMKKLNDSLHTASAYEALTPFSVANQFFSEFGDPAVGYEEEELINAELFVFFCLEYNLIVYHPFRPLDLFVTALPPSPAIIPPPHLLEGNKFERSAFH